MTGTRMLKFLCAGAISKTLRVVAFAGIAVTWLTASAPAAAITITFDDPLDGFTHGSIVDDDPDGTATGILEYGGIKFDVDNFHTSNRDEGRIFDSEKITTTADPDLQRDPADSDENREDWKGGNLLPILNDTQDPEDPLGNVLIIQERDPSSTPDDEGRRSGGTAEGAGDITLTFTTPILDFGLDLIDIENSDTSEDDNGFVEFFSGGDSKGLKTFVSFSTTNGNGSLPHADSATRPSTESIRYSHRHLGWQASIKS